MGKMALGMLKVVKNQQMADMLKEHPNVAEEISDTIKKGGLKEIIDQLKDVS